MFLLLKQIFTLGISIVTAVFISIGIIPEAVLAPEATVPIPITNTGVDEKNTDNFKTELSHTEETIVTEEPEATPAGSDVFEKSLQEALDAIARTQTQVTSFPDSHLTLNDNTRDALVNILCTTAGAGPLNPISASGVIIDPRGVVLTNAHVGQYFLLTNYPTPRFIDCVIRAGSPAYPTYKAELLFLPPSWIAKNAEKIDDERPTGNGEHDYALLRIIGTVSGGALTVPTFLPLVSGSPQEGSPVLVAGYPAGFLGGITIAKELYAASAHSTVGTIYTFDTNTIDLFSVGGSVVAQQGSSGGAVAQSNNESQNGAALLGLIVTSSEAPDTASRDLRALSTEYIIRDFEAERGIPFTTYLSLDLADEQKIFQQTTAPSLTKSLVSALEK